MLYGNLRIIVTGAIAALAVTVPVAQAKQAAAVAPPSTSVSVCNQATHTSVGGDMVATDGDPGRPARFQSNLKAKPGHGAGLVNAAANSPALSLCSVPGGDDDGGSEWPPSMDA